MLPASCLTRMWANGLKFCAKSVSHRTPNASLRKNIAATFFKHSQATSTINRLPVHRTITTRPRTDAILKSESVSPQTLKNDSVRIAKINLLPDEWMMEIKWNNGSCDRYPFIWLRDNCHCSNCFHPTARARILDIKALDTSLVPASINVSDDSSEVEIKWPDGHCSSYNTEWLLERSFRRHSRHKRQQFRRIDKEYWGADLIHDLPTAKYDEIMNDEHALLKFIITLEKKGLVIVNDAPTIVGGLKELTDHIGYWKWSHYGRTFAVKTRVDPINLAYTSGDLLLHTDLAYCQTQPEVQLLHCIEQTSCEGGENVLVDSFYVAEKLRASYPEKFDLLSKTIIDFIDIGDEKTLKEFFMLSQHSLIKVDENGEVVAVSTSHMGRDSHFSAPVEKVKNWYDAMLTFYDLSYQQENNILYKMKDGDIIVFDNSRIMHGRKGFLMTQGVRELEGCYWDWDMVRSCRRVLQVKHGLVSP